MPRYTCETLLFTGIALYFLAPDPYATWIGVATLVFAAIDAAFILPLQYPDEPPR